MNDSSNREAAVFDAARALPPEHRAAYLDRAFAGEPELRRRVEALLAADSAVGEFLEQSGAPAKGETPNQPPHSDLAGGEKPGTVIGRYKILEKVGEGGFGAVYVAEQRETVKRRVALKIIKLGMDTR